MSLKDGKLYLKPIQEGPMPSVPSRAIDIRYSSDSPGDIPTSHPKRYREAQDFQETFEKVQIQENVRHTMHVAWNATELIFLFSQSLK